MAAFRLRYGRLKRSIFVAALEGCTYDNRFVAFLSAASDVTEKSTEAGSLESPLESASSEFWSSEFSLPFRHLFFSFNFKILVFNIFT